MVKSKNMPSKACRQISCGYDIICNDSLSFLALAQIHYNCARIKPTLAITNAHLVVSKSLLVLLNLTQQNIEIYIEDDLNKTPLYGEESSNITNLIHRIYILLPFIKS